MSRRILTAQLALLIVVLLAAVVPLGMTAASHDRQAYRAAALLTARSLASLAEERTGDREGDSGLPGRLSAAVPGGDAAEVVTRDGTVLAQSGRPLPDSGSLPQALAGRTVSSWRGSGDARRLVVALPVGDRTPVAAAVLLSRPAEPLDRTIHLLWLSLAGLAVFAALAAAAVAVALARWVERPLRRLQVAVRRLGEADLAARAGVHGGPPEVRRLAATFDAMAAQLETLVHGHQAVVADVAHQLRTPLAALRLRLELLAEESTDGPATGELAAALGEIARLSRLVDGLLAVARAESRSLAPQAVDVVAAERMQAWQPVADEAGVRLLIDVTAPLAASMADGHLEQTLDNLLDNAITAAPNGGLVTVRAEPCAESIRIVVSDDGPGMSAQDRASAFHRFTGDRSSGTGLGLAIVHRLVTADGGQASLEPSPSGGLAVILLLPAAGSRSGPDTRVEPDAVRAR